MSVIYFLIAIAVSVWMVVVIYDKAGNIYDMKSLIIFAIYIIIGLIIAISPISNVLVY